jgi:hypothetical protein
MEPQLESPADGSDAAYAAYCTEVLDSGFQCEDADSGTVVSQEFFEQVRDIDTGATGDDSLDAALAQLAMAEQACEAGMVDLLASPDSGAAAAAESTPEPTWQQLQQQGAAAAAAAADGRWGTPGRVRSYLLAGSIAMAADRRTLASCGVTHVLNCIGTDDLLEAGGYDGSCSCQEFFARSDDGLGPCEYLRLAAMDDPEYPLIESE